MVKAVIIQILPNPYAVYHGKKPRRVQWRKNAVPCARVQVDALRAVCDKRLRWRFGVFGDDDKEGILRHGDKRLRSQRMAFDQIEGVRQAAGLGVENADAGLPTRKVDFRAVMKALTQASVDQAKITCCIKDIAKWGEC